MISNKEFKKDLAIVFPPERGGEKRPTEPIRTDIEFSTELPQLIAGDPALYVIFNYIFMQLLSNDKVNKQETNNLFDQISKQDFRIATESLKGLMSPEMLEKLNGIAANANNYTHPATHPAIIIALDTLHRFVTDTQINSWNNKADGIHGTHVPAPQTADNAKYLRNDNTWQTVKGLMSPEMLKKLNGVAAGANAYSHPANHPANMITQDSSNRFVTDTEKSTWNAKAPIVSPTFTGTVTAPTLTVTGTLNIPGGRIWIE